MAGSGRGRKPNARSASPGLCRTRNFMIAALIGLCVMCIVVVMRIPTLESPDSARPPPPVVRRDDGLVINGGDDQKADGYNEGGYVSASEPPAKPFSGAGTGGGVIVENNGNGGDGAGNGNDNGNGGGAGNADVEKQNAVRNAFLHAWNGYRQHAWGFDDLEPISKRGKDWLGVGSTISDSLDTMWIMGLKDEFEAAKTWVRDTLSFQKRRGVSTFEMTIRNVGGLLSAFEFSKDRMFLDKAKSLADRLMPAFNTPSGIPYANVDLVSGRGMNPSWAGGSSILSEFGTLQLEFQYLSYHTGDPKYANAVNKPIDIVAALDKPQKLYPIYVSPQTGMFTTSQVTLGALGDSFYEYLLKQWLITGKTDARMRRLYDETMEGVVDVLIKHSSPSGYTYIAEWNNGKTIDKMDHLVCFAGGMFALGAHGATEGLHARIGAEITETCYQMYARQKTGIAPEITHFRNGQDLVPGAAHYLLRPETVESFFVLWRLTHDQKYRDWGWSVFNAIETYCKVEAGYSGIKDVNRIPVQYDNYQQSFFLAETLKYLYLLFSDDSLVPLDKYVFNTEAHPLGVWDPTVPSPWANA